MIQTILIVKTIHINFLNSITKHKHCSNAQYKPKFKHARELVHFHSFSSCRPFTSSITSGTHPPNTNILIKVNNVYLRVFHRDLPSIYETQTKIEKKKIIIQERKVMASVSTNLFPIVVAECRLLGRGIILWIAGFDHVIVSEESSKSSLKHHFED